MNVNVAQYGLQSSLQLPHHNRLDALAGSNKFSFAVTIFGNAQHEGLARVGADAECEHATATCIVFDEFEDFFRVLHFTVGLCDENGLLVPCYNNHIVLL